MKTLILTLVATAALATATAAFACDGGGQHNRARANAGFVGFRHGMEHGLKFGFWAGHGSWSKLSGTGTDFGGTNPSANGSIVAGDHNGGHFVLGLNTTWSAAQTKTYTDDDGDSDDGTYTISCAPSTATLALSNGTSASYTLSGKTCSRAHDGTTTYGFFGETADGSTKAVVKESGTAVTGVVFSGGWFHAGLHLHFGHKR